MQTRRGIARNVRFTTQVEGTSGKHGGSVSTTHPASFELDGVPVHAEAVRPLTVEVGDEVIVAGDMDDGVFNARALRNLT